MYTQFGTFQFQWLHFHVKYKIFNIHLLCSVASICLLCSVATATLNSVAETLDT